jgi:hypothetical protein
MDVVGINAVQELADELDIYFHVTTPLDFEWEGEGVAISEWLRACVCVLGFWKCVSE